MRTDGKKHVFYRRKKGWINLFLDTDGWTMGTGLDGPRCLEHESNTESVPLSGWTCYEGDKDRDDPHLRISPDLAPACGEITITASGEAADKRPASVGVYTPTQLFSAGRRVFKHKT